MSKTASLRQAADAIDATVATLVTPPMCAIGEVRWETSRWDWDPRTDADPLEGVRAALVAAGATPDSHGVRLAGIVHRMPASR